MCDIQLLFVWDDEIDDLERTLAQFADEIRTHNEKAIIAEDFNAKSPQWGMDLTDRRDYVMTKWIVTNNLVIVNHGESPPFKRRDYTSILDLTISTENLKQSITEWKVMEDESLSDHNYIFIRIEKKRMPITMWSKTMNGNAKTHSLLSVSLPNW